MLKKVYILTFLWHFWNQYFWPSILKCILLWFFYNWCLKRGAVQTFTGQKQASSSAGGIGLSNYLEEGRDCFFSGCPLGLAWASECPFMFTPNPSFSLCLKASVSWFHPVKLAKETQDQSSFSENVGLEGARNCLLSPPLLSCVAAPTHSIWNEEVIKANWGPKVGVLFQ